ncbi:MAG: Flp pilus assembly complex ATPase component TadA [Deltaproteobacteria bacterium]|nr:Flp pilus assembly complex ATPase component TadA [Deltaproteobacteria bacterium]
MQPDLNAKIREAEMYQSMGLLEASLEIYSRLLSGSRISDPQLKESIQSRATSLRTEIQELEKEDAGKVSREELSILQASPVADETAETLMESAAALKELGLVTESVVEYEKAFAKNPFAPDLMNRLMDCLFHLHTPRQVVDHFSSLIHTQDIGKPEQARLVFGMGLEFEKREHKDYAIELYKSALEMGPKDNEIELRLNALMTQMAPGSRYDYLINQKLITPGQLQKALVISQKTRKSVEFALIEGFHLKKEDIGKSLSTFYGCPFVSFDPKHPVPFELVRRLKKSFLIHNVWVPLDWGKNVMRIIVDDPKDIRKTDDIKALIKIPNIELSVGIKEDIIQFINLFYEEKAVETKEPSLDYDDIVPDVSYDEETEEVTESLDESTSQVVRLVDQILVMAYRSGVSDIHIEPSPVTNKTGIRFRMDGVCQEYLKVPNTMARGILSRIKIMCNLDISERRLPQDGKIKFRRKGIPPFELRVATVPTAGGFEDVVLRLLAKAGAMKLAQMGLNERNLKIMEKLLVQPYGLILVVGPTGSGKTTTLHAALGHINKPGIKIWTAEDPVEITQDGLRQVEVKPRIGLDFARVMRSFLRADPDVIMIGEMRDEETASIGIEASLTGHLVFSTLHTNSAPETITRLLDMGMNPLNFSDAFLGVLAQRLVRTLCTSCRQSYHPSDEEYSDIVTAYGPEAFKLTGLANTPDFLLHRSVGCDTCAGSGYKGRMGIHELLEGTKEIKRMIKKQASAEDIFTLGASQGMITLKQDAIQKVFQGLTDMKEVNRVCIG